MTDLEQRLHALRDELAWPATPDVAGAVAQRLAAPPARARRAPRMRLSPALAAGLLALLIALGVFAASPDVRARVRDWLGIGAVRIERVERLPDLAPARELGLGRRTTVAAAERAAGFAAPVARALGPPDAVYVDRVGRGRAISLVYVPRPGLPVATSGTGAVIEAFHGDALALVKKLVQGGVDLHFLDVDGADGYFVEGPHALVYADDATGAGASGGGERPDRLAGNTLVWMRGGITYRLEADVGRDAALRIARSVRF